MFRKDRARNVAAGLNASAFGLYHPRARAGQQFGLLNEQAYMYDGHDLLLDFKNGIYKRGDKLYTSVTDVPGYAFSRSATAGVSQYIPDYQGFYNAYPLNLPIVVPGYGYYSTIPFSNYLTNSGMVGATSTTPPTGWAGIGSSGGALTVVGTGVENGLNYIDLKYNYTNNTSSIVYLTVVPPVSGATVPGDIWTNSVYVRFLSRPVISGSVGITITARELNGSGGYLTGSGTTIVNNVSNFDTLPYASFKPYYISRTMNQASVAQQQMMLETAMNVGTSISATLRIAMPMSTKSAGLLMPGVASTSVGVVTSPTSFINIPYSLVDDTDFVMYAVGNFDHSMGSVVERILVLGDGTAANRIFPERNSFSIVMDGVFQSAPGFTVTPTSFNTSGRLVYAIRRRAGKWSITVMNNARQAGVSTENAIAWRPMNVFGIGGSQGPINSYVEKAGILLGTFSDADMLNLVQGVSNRLQNQPQVIVDSGTGYFGSTLRAKYNETGKWQKDTGSGFADVGDGNPQLAITTANQGGNFRWVRTEDGATGQTLNLPYKRFDFTTGVLPSELTFTRSTTATRYNASGIIETLAVNTPRFNYDPVTLKPLGLLVEEARNNNVARSANSTGTGAWGGSPILTINQGVAPDGTNTACLFQRHAAASSYSIIPMIAKEGGAVADAYTFSVYAKKGVGSYLALRAQANYPNVANGIYNLDTGQASVSTFGAFSNASGACTAVGNGWYRCTLTFTTDNTNLLSLYPSFNTSGGQIDGTDPDASANGYLWGAQIERGAFATSYIPTAGAAATRQVELCNYDATTLLASSPEVTVIFKGGYFSIYLNTPYPRLLALNPVNLTGRSGIELLAYSSRFETSVFNNSTYAGGANKSMIYGKTGISVKSSRIITCFNGEAPFTQTPAASVLTPYGTLNIGTYRNSAAVSGHIELVELYGQALPASDLQTLTAS